ncbi:MAG: hypothetical protein AVDCRST_MAG55-1724, partial [uncultured Rubrobacteraceae bacterium]
AGVQRLGRRGLLPRGSRGPLELEKVHALGEVPQEGSL